LGDKESSRVVVPVVRARIYIRISRARRELLDAQRQQPPCESFVKAQGWHLAGVYVDDNRSAWREGVRRDDFERMLGDVRADAAAGHQNAIVTWQADRLLRTVEDASAIVAVAKRHGTLVANVGGSIDLSTADGRRRFYEAAVAARYESDLKSERLRLKHSELAADGHWQGGPRPFGYDLEPYPDVASGRVRYRLIINELEARAIRQGAKAATEGSGSSGIARRWTRDGIRSTTGKVITPTKAREILVSPRIAALRRAGGKLVQADWPAIISREQHEELVALLGPQRRERPGGRASPRRNLLGGLAFCGRCGNRLTSKPINGIRRYYCATRLGGCGGVARAAERVEAHVVHTLLLELPERLLEAARRAPEEWESLGRLMTARQTEEDRLEGLADFLADGTWDRPTYIRQKRRVQARINDLDARIASLRAAAPRRRLKGATIGELQAEWDALDMDEKRSLLADHITRIVVKPAGQGRRFHPDQLEIHWK
jgi:site-specific DNA recombinase